MLAQRLQEAIIITVHQEDTHQGDTLREAVVDSHPVASHHPVPASVEAREDSAVAQEASHQADQDSVEVC